MIPPTKLTAAVAAAHKAARLNKTMIELEIKEVAKHGKKHCKFGHEWCEANTAIFFGRRKCIVCAEAKLEELKGCASYLSEQRALEVLKSGMPQSPFCQSCGGLLINAKCTPCYSKMRRERYADMIKQTFGRDVNVRGLKVTKEFFYYMPKQIKSGTHAAWLLDHGIKVKRPVTEEAVDFNVLDDQEDEL